jgi:hypothetical protein
MARRRTLYQPVMIAAAVAVACAVALLVVSEKAGATFPGKNGRIAYAGWNRGKDFEIYTINPDGSGKTQLTHNNTDDLDPAYSPGRQEDSLCGQRRTQRRLRGRANRRVTFRTWRLSGRSNRGFITR